MDTPSCSTTASSRSYRVAAPAHSCSGQGAVEFLAAAVPVLLLGLGSVEAIHWYFARQAVSLALMQAGRAAITQHADPAVIDAAFQQALLPLYAAPTPAETRRRLTRAMQRRTDATGLPPWRIYIASPSDATFADYGRHDPQLSQNTNVLAIDNDYLRERHQDLVSGGWKDGRGPTSGQTALQANTLVLRLTWLHEPLVPGVRNLLRQIAPADARHGSVAMRQAGYLPMRREIALVMQSHAAAAWTMPAHGRVARLSHDAAGEPPIVAVAGAVDGMPGGPANSSGLVQDPANAAAPWRCVGLWCLDTAVSGVPESDAVAPGGSGSAGEPPPGDGSGQGPGGMPDTAGPGHPGGDAAPGYPPNGPGPAQPGAPGPLPGTPDTTGADPSLEDCPGCCS